MRLRQVAPGASPFAACYRWRPLQGKGGAGAESVAGPARQAPAALKPPADTPIAVRDMSPRRTLLHILILTALTAATTIVLAAPALAKSYTDVPKSHWAYSSISSVTNRAVDGHRLLDDYGELFRPERAITRELLARSIVLASGHYGEHITPVDDRRRAQGPPLLHGHPDGRASGVHGGGQGGDLPADGDGRRGQRRARR